MSNSAPTISAPEGLTFSINSFENLLSGLSVSDADDDTLTVTLTVEGALTFGSITGLTFTDGDGENDSTMTFSGSVADINAALATLTYTPATDDTNGDTLQISVSDGEHFAPAPFDPVLKLSELDGTNGFTIKGVDSQDSAGVSVSYAGDVNGDGIDDIIIGANDADPNNRNRAGETYVVFGTTAGFGDSLELSDLDGTNGFTLLGVTSNDQSGYAVSDAGDVNGDGVDDIIIGAYFASPDGKQWAGESYLVFGNSTGFNATMELSALNGSNGFAMKGAQDGDESGYRVSAAGDINGDGLADVIISASHADRDDNTSIGEAYIIYGSTSGFEEYLELSDIDGSNGFVLKGINAFDRAGSSISEAGDINGDGIDDIIIGTPYADAHGIDDAGETYVVFGASSGFDASFELSDLDGSNGFTLLGSGQDFYTGGGVSDAGDINGDGIDDIVIGAYSADVADPNTGQVYVVFGNTTGFSSGLELTDLNGTNGFVVHGLEIGDLTGNSVSSAGDVNGDGIDDLLISAPAADHNDKHSVGETYIIFGTTNGFASSFDLSDINGSNGFAIYGIDNLDFSGRSVSSAGDLNGDGVSDLIINAAEASPDGKTLAGESYVVYGSSAIAEQFAKGSVTIGLTNSDPLISAPESKTFTPNSTDNAISGLSVSDVNGGTLQVVLSVEGTLSLAQTTGLTFSTGDGINDSSMTFSGSVADINAALTTLTYTPATDDTDGDTLQIRVSDGFTRSITAGTFAAVIELSDLDGTNGFVIKGITVEDAAGLSVSSAGDLNGDGFDDVIVGAVGADPNGLQSGATYVVFGTGQQDASVELSDLDGTNGFVLNGVTSYDYSGTSVSSGDINGDGIDDVIVGANGLDANGEPNSGGAYVLFGSTGGFSSSLELSDLDGTTGFVINGKLDLSGSGRSVSSADVNGDDVDDVIIGAPYTRFEDIYGHNFFAKGESYVVFGHTGGFASSMDLTDLDGWNGFTMRGIDESDFSGYHVSGAGDVNGDGFEDIIIGAYTATPNGTNSGESYVVFGLSNGFIDLIELSSLDGSNGFVIHGKDLGDYVGYGVSSAGDINGDGLDDIIIGGSGGDPGGREDAGETFVIFGSTASFSASPELSDLDGSNGFVINGINPGDFAGYSVSSLGDVNGDGLDDVIVGARDADPNGDASGQSYVVFGNASGFAAAFELSDIDGSNGFIINGATLGDGAGASISAAGDVNGDGVNDLLIGAGFADANGNQDAGESYVVYGSANIAEEFTTDSVEINLVNSAPTITAPDTQRFTINSSDNGIIGLSIADPDGDDIKVVLTAEGSLSLSQTTGLTFTDGDGTDDTTMTFSGSVADINAALATLTYTPATDDTDGDTLSISVSDGQHFNYIPATFPADVQLSDLDGSDGFVINGIDSDDNSGWSVSSAGDLNGDGIDDVIIGAPYADLDGHSDAGETYVVFGTGTGVAASFELSDLDGANGFIINGIDAGDSLGWSVAAAGDVNGDGVDDIIIGASSSAPGDGPDGDSTFVVFGTTSGYSASLDLSSLDGTNGFSLVQIDGDDNAGHSVSSAGDVNGDGIDDIIVGAQYAAPGGRVYAGQSYVVFGTNAGFDASVQLSDLDGSNGFLLNGIVSNDHAGRSVSSAGDFNGDGIDDIVIGASGAGIGYPRENAGESYVVFGATTGFAVSLELSDLDGSNGVRIFGGGLREYSGSSVSSAGDVNGDGIDDIIIGATHAKGSATDSGASYIVFGNSTGFAASLELSDLDGSNGFVIGGTKSRQDFGQDVSAAGDVNGDGIDDLIIGSPKSKASGDSFVLFGNSNGFAARLDTKDLTGSAGFAIRGIDTRDSAGWSVADAGDVNGDGIDDLIISAPSADPNGIDNAGEAYIIFGSATIAELFTTASIEIDLYRDSLRDFGLDGTSDIMFQGEDGVFYRLDDPALSATPSNEGHANHLSIGLADLNGDGVLDNIVQDPSNSKYWIQFSGTDDGALKVSGARFDILGFADLDGDGVDEAIGDPTKASNTGFFMIDDNLTTVIDIGLQNKSFIGFGDFDGNGSEEALFAREDGVLFSYGAEAGEVTIGKKAFTPVAIGDFNGDGTDDILVQKANAGDRYHLIEGDETNPLADDMKLGFKNYDLEAVGDFDGDGVMDILARRQGLDFYMLTEGITKTVQVGWDGNTLVGIGDFNGDGEDDILLALDTGKGRLVYSGDRDNMLTINGMVGSTVRDIADYNGDGEDDLLVQDDATGVYSILESATGSEITLDAILANADVIDPYGLDTLGLSDAQHAEPAVDVLEEEAIIRTSEVQREHVSLSGTDKVFQDVFGKPGDLLAALQLLPWADSFAKTEFPLSHPHHPIMDAPIMDAELPQDPFAFGDANDDFSLQPEAYTDPLLMLL